MGYIANYGCDESSAGSSHFPPATRLAVNGHTELDYNPYLKPFDDFVCMLRLEKFGFWLQTCYHVNHCPAQDGTVFDEYERSVLRGLVGDGMFFDIHFEGVLCFDL